MEERRLYVATWAVDIVAVAAGLGSYVSVRTIGVAPRAATATRWDYEGHARRHSSKCFWLHSLPL